MYDWKIYIKACYDRFIIDTDGVIQRWIEFNDDKPVFKIKTERFLP